MTGRALGGLALLTGFVLAQNSDALKPQPATPGSTLRADTVVQYRPARSTGNAVLLSLLLPGGGQVYTGNWWKAALIAPGELTLAYLSYREQDAGRRTALLWWTGAVIAFSMADAYVSAQMYGFDREMRLTVGPLRAGIAMEF